MALDLVILVDADACVPEPLCADLGIHTVPAEADPFDPAEPPQALRKSAAPLGPGFAPDAVAAVEAALGEANAVLYLGAGDGFGGCPEALATAGALPGVRTVASAAALMGCGWQAVAAAQAARAGGGIEDALRAAEQVRGRTQVLLMLEHPGFAGVQGSVAGALFGARPLVRLAGPAIEVIERLGRRDHALVALRERFAAEAHSPEAGTGGLHVAVHHAGAEAAAEAMALWVERTLHPDEVVIAPLTRHAASRLGPELVGFAWYREAE